MDDEVDEIVAGWAAARPDLDPTPMHLLSRIRRLAQVLDEHRSEAFATHGIGAHEFDVLSVLRRQGGAGGLTPGQLLQLTHVTSGTMTNRLDRLESRRLVRRSTDPRDGRQVVVTLTALGRRRVDGALAALLDVESALVAHIPARERDVTVRSLRLLLARATESAAKLADA